MAAKTSWHRYVTKLRHCHPMYTSLSSMMGPVLTTSQENSLFYYSICILDRNFHLTFTMLLHYLVKFEVVILSTSLSSRTGPGTSSTGGHLPARANDTKALFRTLCGRPTVHIRTPLTMQCMWGILQERVYKNQIQDVVRNDEVSRKESNPTAIIQSRRLSILRHIARMDRASDSSLAPDYCARYQAFVCTCVCMDDDADA